jgi:hypothetical protein
MTKIYKFDTVLEDGRYKNKTVLEVFRNHPDFIFKTLQKWAINGIKDKEFDDEVLNAAHIIKKVNSSNYFQEEFSVPRDKEALKPLKKLRKENKTLDEIVDEMEEERYKNVGQNKNTKKIDDKNDFHE